MATVGQRRKKWKLALSITVTLLGQIWLLVKSSKWLQLQNHPDDWAVLSRIEFEARKGVSKRGSNDLGEQKNKKVKNEPNENRYDDSDQHCIFRDSPIYRSVFVYPSPGENEWQGDILTPHGKVRTNLYPWQESE